MREKRPAKPIIKLLHALKYQNVKGISLFCARLLYEACDFPKTQYLTFVPLHPHRENQRGFNQAEVMAKELSRLTSKPCLNLLHRTRHTLNQAALKNRTQRLTHLEKMFVVDVKVLSTLNREQLDSILIIDDVTTTGTTLNECAQVLKKSGFKKVYGLVVAHGN